MTDELSREVVSFFKRIKNVLKLGLGEGCGTL